jgi:hypothetical protein
MLMESMKSDTDTPSAEYLAFDRAMVKILSVPHDEVQRRIKEHKAQTAKNPRKRGPKPRSSA